MSILRVLVVCTANICRSPAGQAFLARGLSGRRARVQSAGTLAQDGNPADTAVQDIAEGLGFPEVRQHRSRALMPSHLAQFDLILCMEQAHIDWVRKVEPTAVGKTKLFGHWSGRRGVADPVGGPRDAYERALGEMQVMARQWTDKILELGLCE